MNPPYSPSPSPPGRSRSSGQVPHRRPSARRRSACRAACSPAPKTT